MKISSDQLNPILPKDKYRVLCTEESTIPIFSRAWWLDAVAGDQNWDVAIVENSGRIDASMPFGLTIANGSKVLGMTPETQSLGPWLRPTQMKYSRALGREKKLMKSLISNLPPFDVYSQNWHHTITNWLPFYWEGFKQTTRYTYRLPDISNESKIWDGLRENIRTDIRKAENRFNLEVRTDLGITTFWKLFAKTYARQGKPLPHTEEFIVNLDKKASLAKSRKIFIAIDSKGQHHAGVYLVWDQNSAYYLMGGGDPTLRNSGASSLCLWEAIRFARGVTKSFDFEGSMIESVEKFFRAFGAIQTQYSFVTKNNDSQRNT